MITIDMIRLGIRNRTRLPLNQMSKQMRTTGKATKNQCPDPSASIHDLIPSICYFPFRFSRVVIAQRAPFLETYQPITPARAYLCLVVNNQDDRLPTCRRSLFYG